MSYGPLSTNFQILRDYSETINQELANAGYLWYDKNENSDWSYDQFGTLLC